VFYRRWRNSDLAESVKETDDMSVFAMHSGTGVLNCVYMNFRNFDIRSVKAA
jgi:hypothetical protein